MNTKDIEWEVSDVGDIEIREVERFKFSDAKELITSDGDVAFHIKSEDMYVVKTGEEGEAVMHIKTKYLEMHTNPISVSLGQDKDTGNMYLTWITRKSDSIIVIILEDDHKEGDIEELKKAKAKYIKPKRKSIIVDDEGDMHLFDDDGEEREYKAKEYSPGMDAMFR